MPRIALYSHDTMGLGHIRRNLRLAQALVGSRPDATVLLVSGTHLGGAFPLPHGVDCVTLPALAKDELTGGYRSRHLSVDLEAVLELRRSMLRAALRTFSPDVFVVDNVPLGALGELEPALQTMSGQGITTIVLGLRDVLDEPDVVKREWARAGHHEAIERYFDQIWIYGDPTVYDVAAECAFPETTRRRIRYVGYLDRSEPETDGSDATVSMEGAYTLCMVGGGQDGGAIARAFAASAFPTGEQGLLVTGPFMPACVVDDLGRLAGTRPDLRVVDFIANPAPLLARATRVVGMAGYNSVCEILSYRKQALLVPRERPRREQLIRAERLQRLGLVDMLPTDCVSPTALSEWMHRPPRPLRGGWPALSATTCVTAIVDDLTRVKASVA